MTFDSMPGLSELPWLPGEPASSSGVGYPVGPRSILVFAMRTGEHMRVTAAFQKTQIDPELVRRILVDVPPPAGA